MKKMILGFAWLLVAGFLMNSPVAAATFPGAAFPDGVCVNTGAKYNLTAQDMQLAQAAGVKYFRIDLKWEWVEKTQGNYTWTDFDALLTLMDSYGIKPVFMLAYTHKFYNTDSLTMNEATERQGFANFAAAAVARYEHQRTGTIWELWNEQNTSPFWNVTEDGNQNTPTAAVARAENYMTYIDVVVPAMRAANPNATIISGGVINAAWNVTTSWFQKCFTLGLLTKVDGLGVHLYGGNSNVSVERYVTEMKNLRDLVVANGGSANFPILNTEFGVSTTEYGGSSTLQQAEQAAVAARSYIMSRAAGVPLHCWYEWRTGGTMSMLDNSFGTRPAYTALSTLGSQLAGYTFESRKNIGSPDDYAMVFVNGSQRKLVVWTTDAVHNVTIPVTSGSSFATKDYLGNSGSIGVVSGNINLSISSRPVYITLGTSNVGTTASDAIPSQDIGAVGLVGSVGVRDGKYWLRGSGNDIYGTSDQFRFAYQQITGDVTLTARVLSLGATNGNARSGVMIRDGLAANARYAATFVNPSGKAQFFRRSAAGGGTSVTDSSTVTPHWVRIVRSGSTFTSYRSADGVNWGSAIGSVTLTGAPATMYVGLVSCSHTNTQLTTAVYDNVTPDLGGGTTPAVQFDPYQQVEAESHTAQKGVLRYVGGSYYKVGGIENSDWLEFAGTDFGSGALSFTARVSSNGSGGTIQIRTGSPIGTLVGSVTVPGTGGWENFVDVQTTISGATGLQNLYLVFTGGSGSLFDLDYFQFEPADTAPPLVSEDIGSPALAGSASVSGGAYTIQAGGTDIWLNSDQFHFLHHSMTGDGEAVVRVDSLVNTHASAKAGIMMRATTAANSAYAFNFVTPTSGRWYQKRNSSGAYASSVTSTSGAAPTWLKLVRSGNNFTSFVSADGTTWTQLGAAQTITMPTTIEVGMAVTSHNAAALTTAVFSELQTP